MGKLKDAGKKTLRNLFELGQNLGFDILPHHFYSEIPNINELKKSNYWKIPYSMIEVNGIDTQEQIAFVSDCFNTQLIDFLNCNNIHSEASKINNKVGFGPIEADFLFAFISKHQPKQIFQIGCGVSTAVCLKAANYACYAPEIICVEPYPNNYLREIERQGRITLINEKAQSYCPINIEKLDSDVLFFVDSTHTLGPSGEVSRIILEMLPRLKKGAWVHFHDIKFPYDYDRNILDSALFFQHESVLLHAFLVGNNRFKICASLSMLHYSCPTVLAQFLTKYKPASNDEGLNSYDSLNKQEQFHFPSSTYLIIII